jgi:hypothetical protein
MTHDKVAFVFPIGHVHHALPRKCHAFVALLKNALEKLDDVICHQYSVVTRLSSFTARRQLVLAS